MNKFRGLVRHAEHLLEYDFKKVEGKDEKIRLTVWVNRVITAIGMMDKSIQTNGFPKGFDREFLLYRQSEVLRKITRILGDLDLLMTSYTT